MCNPVLEYPKTGYHADVVITSRAAAHRIECQLCAGKGTLRGRAFLKGSRRNRCRLCHGDGSIPRSVIQQLCEQMQKVVNAMQAGDEARAAIEARTAARLAGRLMARRRYV